MTFLSESLRFPVRELKSPIKIKGQLYFSRKDKTSSEILSKSFSSENLELYPGIYTEPTIKCMSDSDDPSKTHNTHVDVPINFLVNVNRSFLTSKAKPCFGVFCFREKISNPGNFDCGIF